MGSAKAFSEMIRLPWIRVQISPAHCWDLHIVTLGPVTMRGSPRSLFKSASTFGIWKPGPLEMGPGFSLLYVDIVKEAVR